MQWVIQVLVMTPNMISYATLGTSYEGFERRTLIFKLDSGNVHKERFNIMRVP